MKCTGRTLQTSQRILVKGRLKVVFVVFNLFFKDSSTRTSALPWMIELSFDFVTEIPNSLREQEGETVYPCTRSMDLPAYRAPFYLPGPM